MKNRILVLLVVISLLLTFVPFGAVRAEAASEFVASEEVIQMIINWEGFSSKPYWDYGQWTVGYGTRAPDEHLERYRAEGISREEAKELLNTYLVTMGRSVNSFADKFGLTLTQNQFDAMLSFTYNCGSMWMLSANSLRSAIIEGKTGDDLVFHFAEWSAAGSVLMPALTRRRLSEVNLYLNGVYDNTPPSNYNYVYFDPAGGKATVRTQGFITGEPVNIRSTATYDGCVFEGWYTDATGGEKVEKLDSSLNGYTLYAHWRAGEGTGNPQDTPAETISGTPVDYMKQITSLTLNAFDQPVKGALVVDAFMEGDIVDIIAEYTDSTGVKWGKVQSGGWINLTYTQDPQEETEDVGGITVKVTTTDVNIRRGPGTAYTVVGQATLGQELVITKTSTGSGYTWGKFNRGWIALKYTNYDEVVNNQIGGENPDNDQPETTPPENDQNDATQPTNPENNNSSKGKMGTVTADYLYIRSGAGVAQAVVGGLTKNTRVQILEQKAVGGVIWGRIDKGWISLSYVKLDDESEQKPEDNKPETQPDDTSTEDKPVTGKVKLTSGSLNIRSGPSTGYSKVGSYANGTSVTILEQKTVGTVNWGRTDKGWISMTYVKLDEPAEETKPEETKPEETKPEETKPEETKPDETKPEDTTPQQKPEQTPGQTEGEVGTVSITSGTLRIRSGAGTNNAIVGNLRNGDKVTITERTTVAGVVWGKMEKGWISLDYVKFNTTSTEDKKPDAPDNDTDSGNDTSTQQTVTGKVNVNDYLCIRNGAGTNYTVVGYYTKGTAVTITEQKMVGDTKWGRTAKGWISMTYVTLDGQPSTEDTSKPEGTSGTVTGSGLRIRSGAGTGNRIVGRLEIGDKVIILETTTVDGTQWGRISQGWICLDYVKMD